MRTDVLILGAGREGLSAAMAARAAGLSAAVLECEAFGADAGDNEALAKAAAAAGVIMLDTEPSFALKDGFRLIGVTDGSELFLARWTLDATGRRAWLVEALDLCRGGEDWELASFHEAWTQTSTPAEFSVAGGPMAKGGLDMNWRHHDAAAGAGYFLLEEAASTLPGAVCRAHFATASSGTLCARLMNACARGLMTEAEAAAAYLERVNHQFFTRAWAIRETRSGPLDAGAVRAISRARAASEC